MVHPALTPLSGREALTVTTIDIPWLARATSLGSGGQGTPANPRTPPATEPTLRPAFVAFLKTAARDLGIGQVGVRGELRLAGVGQPDLQVVDARGAAIGAGVTKVPGSAGVFASVPHTEQVARYHASLENVLVTDFLSVHLFRVDGGRLDVTPIETPGRLAAGAHAVSQSVVEQMSPLLCRPGTPRGHRPRPPWSHRPMAWPGALRCWAMRFAPPSRPVPRRATPSAVSGCSMCADSTRGPRPASPAARGRSNRVARSQALNSLP